MMRGWISRYSEIARELGLSRGRDSEAALMLDSIIRNPVPVRRIRGVLEGRAVFVIGSGPSLSGSIPTLKRHAGIPKIVADSAVGAVIGNGIFPDVVVTDLDGDEESLRRAGRGGSMMIVHAHGDNMSRLHLAGGFENCIGTTQGRAVGRLNNFGGFTDGDRAVFIAVALGARKVILFGMDLGGRIGRLSGTRPSERAAKLRKLRVARGLLQWLAQRTSCELYTTSGPIPGFKKIRRGAVGGIVSA